MADWPLQGDGQKLEADARDTANSRPVTLTSHASANTKGSYLQLIASTARASQGLLVTFGRIGTADVLVDIAVGAAASETVIVPNLLYSVRGIVQDLTDVFLPVPVPAGTRVSARSQGGAGSAQCLIAVDLVSRGFLPSSPLALVTAYGADTSDSTGVSVDPGGTANTLGSWTEITSSTTSPCRQLIVAFGGQANTARTTCTWLVDIGVGAGGSEQIVHQAVFARSSTNQHVGPGFVAFDSNVPTGSRLAARAQCSINDATDRLLDVVLYGVT
jgi:hypothetical protein